MNLPLAELCGFALLAGLLDAIVGGGGLIQLPALFVLLPKDLEPAVVLGTSKFAGVWGTIAASIQYSRRLPIDQRAGQRVWLPACAAALLASFAGARAVSYANPAIVRPLVLSALLVALTYTMSKKNFGALHAPRLGQKTQTAAALAVGITLGFYDGFVGPGTGSFLIFAFVGIFGFSFLAASATAKRINVVTNVAALSWFLTQGDVLFATAVPMAVFAAAGSIVGAKLALRHGSGFVRVLFIAIVAVLIARFAYEIYPIRV